MANPSQPHNPVPRYKFPATYRIKKRGDFVTLQKNGRKAHTPHLLLVYAPSPLPHSRFGITITKKVALRSNRRALFKRRMRELFRLNHTKFREPLDLIAIGRQQSTDCSYAELRREFLGALKHNRLLKA